jgi:hypothetical protein
MSRCGALLPDWFEADFLRFYFCGVTALPRLSDRLPISADPTLHIAT